MKSKSRQKVHRKTMMKPGFDNLIYLIQQHVSPCLMIPELCYVLPFFIVSIYLINVQPKNHELILFKTEYTGCLPDIRVCWQVLFGSRIFYGPSFREIL